MPCSSTYARTRNAESTGIPGSLILERNVLEWRLDPRSDARIAQASGHGVRLIIFCSEGYASGLAAASLQDLGLWRATDLDGGFRLWRAVGFPTVTGGTRADHYVPTVGHPLTFDTSADWCGHDRGPWT